MYFEDCPIPSKPERGINCLSLSSHHPMEIITRKEEERGCTCASYFDPWCPHPSHASHPTSAIDFVFHMKGPPTLATWLRPPIETSTDDLNLDGRYLSRSSPLLPVRMWYLDIGHWTKGSSSSGVFFESLWPILTPNQSQSHSLLKLIILGRSALARSF